MPRHGSWVAKIKVDERQMVSLTGEAVLLKDEYIVGLNEHATDELVISCLKKKNLIQFYQGLTKHKEIVAEYAEANDNKHSIRKLPGIDDFLICAGKELISLVSLRSSKMQTLIRISSQPYFAQPGVLFPEEFVDDGTSEIHMAFSSQFVNKDDKLEYQVHRATLRDDFQKTLDQVGHLPSVQLDNLIKNEQTIKQQTYELEQAKQQAIEMEALKSKYNKLVEKDALKKDDAAQMKIKQLYEIIEKNNDDLAEKDAII